MYNQRHSVEIEKAWGNCEFSQEWLSCPNGIQEHSIRSGSHKGITNNILDLYASIILVKSSIHKYTIGKILAKNRTHGRRVTRWKPLFIKEALIFVSYFEEALGYFSDDSYFLCHLLICFLSFMFMFPI